MLDNQPNPVTVFGDVASLGAIVGTLLGLLPAIAAVVAVVWYLIQIYESDTCRGILARASARWKRRKFHKKKLTLKPPRHPGTPGDFCS